ncbi:hypothetical protein CsSME_00014341 [Camellia sinensis var. sinensis]
MEIMSYNVAYNALGRKIISPVEWDGMGWNGILDEMSVFLYLAWRQAYIIHIHFIFDAAAKFCVNIATHQHGCCVLNRCIDKSEGKYQEKLVAEIAAHALILAQDAFG